MTKNTDSWVSYKYYSGDEAALDEYLKLFEDVVGGNRQPHWGRVGGIDLVTFLEIVISFTAGVTITPLLKKYFEGLLNADELKNLGSKHRAEIRDWFKKVEDNIRKLIAPIIEDQKPSIFHTNFHIEGKALALRVHFRDVECFIVLNHATISKSLLDSVPQAVTKVINYLITHGVPEDTHVIQIYYDIESEEWRYLFMPTSQGFGSFIDRYVDFKTGELININRSDDFVKTFLPSVEDRLKFLVDSERYKNRNN